MNYFMNEKVISLCFISKRLAVTSGDWRWVRSGCLSIFSCSRPKTSDGISFCINAVGARKKVKSSDLTLKECSSVGEEGRDELEPEEGEELQTGVLEKERELETSETEEGEEEEFLSQIEEEWEE
ncbi:unnamed protein product [Rhizophagus irregularis]|nr:unnamed protein product [Rhizophagus irregularis]